MRLSNFLTTSCKVRIAADQANYAYQTLRIGRRPHVRPQYDISGSSFVCYIVVVLHAE